MRTAAIMESQTPLSVVPYPIATRSYNLRRVLIALGAVIAEMAFLEKVCMIFLETIIIRWFDFTSFATCLHTVLVAVGILFPDPAERFLDVGNAD
jgi:hypothetical protein